jgi:hypothetical protein
MWDPFWTFGPSISSFGASQQATEATNRAEAAEMRVRDLEHRVERLALACNAMWNLLRTQSGLTDQQLQEKIKQIDAADGVTDGRAAHAMVQCPGCGRSVSPRRGKCIYCGANCGDPSAFEAT